MFRSVIFLSLFVVNFSLILCKNHNEYVNINQKSIEEEYQKTKFEFFKNPWTAFWRLGLEPTCVHFHKTIRTICSLIRHKLENKLKLSKLNEKSENMQYGCRQLKLHISNGPTRIQRANRCPLALEPHGENIFISHGYTISNSYYLYVGKDYFEKGKKNKIKAEDAPDARLLALVKLDNRVWLWTTNPDEQKKKKN